MVQRWLCRNCGYRFSQSNVKVNIAAQILEQSNPGKNVHKVRVASQDRSFKESSDDLPFKVREDVCSHNTSNLSILEKGLNALPNYNRYAEVCDSLRSSKNLAQPQLMNGLAGATTDLKGIILEYAWKMKKRGQAETTIKDRTFRLNGLVKKGADLMNPDSVETVLATENWTLANKRFYVNAYLSFTKAFKIPWEPIKVSCEPKEVFIPLESELDALICGSGKKTATFLQVLKTTGARCGEARQLKWTDINMEANTVSINAPEKGSRSRTVKVPSKTIAMLNSLPKTSLYVFNAHGSQDAPKARALQGVFSRTRDKLVRNLQNPRLRQIHFHTFRHWFATMLYAKTRDILYVKQQLGHKRVENTEVYTHLIAFGSEEYHTAFATTLKEEDKLIQEGFEFIRYSEKDQVAIYRKRK
jgi:integrase